MIIGIGVDVVDVSRFAATIDRVPRLVERLFAPQERDMPVQSLAARFAAKEAIAKALGSPGGLRWHDAVILRAPGRRRRSTCQALLPMLHRNRGLRCSMCPCRMMGLSQRQ